MSACELLRFAGWHVGMPSAVTSDYDRQLSYRDNDDDFDRQPSYRDNGDSDVEHGVPLWLSLCLGIGCRSKTRKRSRSRSNSSEHDHRVHNSGSHTSRGHGSRSRSRSRSMDRYKRHRSKSREREHSRRRRSRSRERRRPNRVWNRRSWSKSPERRSRSPVDLRDRIDKAKLRQIAIVNAYNNMQTGHGPAIEMKSEQMAALKSGGYSVEELTDFCKKIADKDKDRRSDDSDSDSPVRRPATDDDDDGTTPFIHHPFKMREFQANIVMNIKNSRQLSTAQLESRKSAGTLHMQFPVSSGNQHRANEWVPVEVTTATTTTTTSTTPTTAAQSEGTESAASTTTTSDASATAVSGAVGTPTMANVVPQCAQSVSTARDVAVDLMSQATLDISQVVSERLSALRQLACNPQDEQAKNKMDDVQKKMNTWAKSGGRHAGRFTGNREVFKLPNKQLHSGPQAWAKKDQFIRAKPVQGGIGMQLLERMGWKKGEGLGRNNEGSLEPLVLDVKMDRKGLSSMSESAQQILKAAAVTSAKRSSTPYTPDLSGKHPISALMELCSKQKWGAPNFTLVDDEGPDHKKSFLFKVVVNGREYQSSVHSPNKKQAKAMSATVCLQQLGLLPH